MKILTSVSLAFILLFTLSFAPALTTAATKKTTTQSAASLEAQKKKLQQEAEQARQLAAQKAAEAQKAAARISQVNDQISSLQGSISSTEQAINDTQAQINQENQDIAGLESEKRGYQDEMDAMVRQMYIMRISLSDELVLFSNEPVSKRDQNQAQLDALRTSVTALYAKTTQAQMAIQKSRDELLQKSQQLSDLRDQQNEQRTGLANFKNFQAGLQANAQQAMAQYDAQAAADERKVSALEAKIVAQVQADIAAAQRRGIPSGGSGRGVGQHVNRGDRIGHEGSTGNSSGPHVHLELRINGSPVDPWPYEQNGTLMPPVSTYTITQGFGYTDYARSGAYGGNMHTGVDHAGPYGQNVYAPISGTIIVDQYYGGYGNVVVIQPDAHSNWTVWCAHMTGG